MNSGVSEHMLLAASHGDTKAPDIHVLEPSSGTTPATLVR